jgi:hypothetical protein
MALLDSVVRIFSTFLKHAAPATPDTDMAVAYLDTDKIFKVKDDVGAVQQMVPEAVIADDTKVLGNVAGVLQYVEAGGGAVDSVNGATGVVVLDAGDINCTDPTTAASGTMQDALTNLFTLANSGKTAIAAAIGSPASGSDTFTTLAGHIDTDRATMATNLTAKGVTAASSETLAALAAKIADIEAGGGVGYVFSHPALVKEVTFDAMPTGSPTTLTFAGGKVGNYMRCDAYTAYAEILDTASYLNGNKFSVSLWAKRGSSLDKIICGCFNGVATDPRYYIQFDASGYPLGRVQDGDNVSRVVTSNVSAAGGNWHHLVMTVNKESKQMSLYMDGSNKGTVSWATNPVSATRNLFIGQNGNGTYFDGAIDQVRLFNDVISASDVTALYNSGNGV